MTAKEMVEAVARAAEFLVNIPGANISLGQVSHETLCEMAATVGLPVQRFVYARPEGPMVLERMEWRPFGVYADVGTTYLPAGPGDDLSRVYDVTLRDYVDLRPKEPTACSECSGPLEDDEALFGPDGKARCSNCSEKDEDEARPYRGNVCADDEDPKATTQRILAAEYQRQQGEGYGPGREG